MSGYVRLGYLATFSCKPKEIDEKCANFFADQNSVKILVGTIFLQKIKIRL